MDFRLLGDLFKWGFLLIIGLIITVVGLLGYIAYLKFFA